MPNREKNQLKCIKTHCIKKYRINYYFIIFPYNKMDLTIDTEKVIFNKDNLKFIRKDSNNYSLEFILENNNIELSKIIDFNIIKLIHSLNNDIYEKVNLVKKDDNNATVTVLVKNFFEDIGLPQYFVHVDVKKNITDEYILFEAQSNTEKPEDIPQDVMQMNIHKLITKCDIVTNHKISVVTNVVFDKKIKVPLFVEKMASLILNKIFKRLKQFIENLTL